MSTHQPQPLTWLMRSETSSCVDFGSADWMITRLVLPNRLPNLAPISLSVSVKRGSMTTRCRWAGAPDSTGT
jgi:hypothetical protein